jgi:hypothetical protein
MSRILNLQKLQDPQHKYLVLDGEGESSCSWIACGQCSSKSETQCGS